MKKIKFYNHFSLLYKAFASTHREAFASVVILLILTIIFTFVLWLAEKNFSILDSLAWVVVKYVGDPAEVASSPVTIFGQVIGTMVGVLGVAIFAVPAGLIGSGLLDAMAEEREREDREEQRFAPQAFPSHCTGSILLYQREGTQGDAEGCSSLQIVPSYHNEDRNDQRGYYRSSEQLPRYASNEHRYDSVNRGQSARRVGGCKLPTKQ